MGIMEKYINEESRNKFMTAFFDSLEKEDSEALEKIKSLENYSMVVRLEEEGIKWWESYLKLKKYDNWTLQDRVERILYTLNSNQYFTMEFIKEQCKIFTNGEIEVNENFEKYHFTIQFTSIIGIPPNMENVKEMIELNKPAHLTYDIKFRYRTHRELQAFTHKELQAFTHAELRARGVI